MSNKQQAAAIQQIRDQLRQRQQSVIPFYFKKTKHTVAIQRKRPPKNEIDVDLTKPDSLMESYIQLDAICHDLDGIYLI